MQISACFSALPTLVPTLLYIASIQFQKGAQNLWDDMRGGRSYEKGKEDFDSTSRHG
jgi:hypothetical protein